MIAPLRTTIRGILGSQSPVRSAAMAACRTYRRPVGGRSGLTLVELLVVITIFVMLVAVVLPLAKPALKGRGARESARQLSTLLMAAQAKAQATGKHHGVLLKLLPNSDPNDPATLVSLAISTVGMPPPIVLTRCLGTVRVQQDQFAPFGVRHKIPATDYPYLLNALGPLNGVVPSKSSMVQIGSGGRILTIASMGLETTASPPYGWIAFGVLTNSGPSFADSVMPSTTVGQSIRVFTEPRIPRYAASGSIDLPAGAYLDLAWSGVGTFPTATHAPGLVRPASSGIHSITLMFGPDGSLDWIYGTLVRPALGASVAPITIPGPFRPGEDIHLLVSNDKRKATSDTIRPKAGSLWITINHRTGGVTTSENVGSLQTNDVAALVEARQGINKVQTAAGL